MQAGETDDADEAREPDPRRRFGGPSQVHEFHQLPTASQIAAMASTRSLANGELGSLHRRSLQASEFGGLTLERLSSTQSQAYVGSAAVNVTRTLSLDSKEWDRLLARAESMLLPTSHYTGRTPRGQPADDTEVPDPKFKSIFRLPMISPFSTFSLSWHMLMLLMDLTYTAFVVPIGVGFDVSDTYWTWCAVCDFLAGVFFVIDMLLGFHTGYVISFNLRKRVVMDGRQVAKWYTLRGSFFVDLMSSVAWITQVVLIILTLCGTNQRKLASQIQIMRLLRLVRLGRLFRAIFLSTAGQGLMMLLSDTRRVNATLLYFLQLLYAIAVLMNFLGCLWYWVALQEGFDQTWVTAYSPYITKYGEDGELNSTLVLQRISKPNLYLTSVYWAITTVSTVGYGDVSPQTAPEEGVAICVFVLGIIFFGVLVGSLTQLLQSASKNARKASVYREKMDHVEGWIRQRQLPTKLRRKIRDYYGQYWLRQADESDEAELLQELPHTLRTEALWCMARKSLGALPIFARLPLPLQFLIASIAKPRKLPPGYDISTQGGPATRMWLIEFGKVVPVFNDIEGGLQAENFLLNAPALLQELDSRFLKSVRGYRTLTACGVWEWNIVSLLGVCKHHHGLYEHLAKDIVGWLERKLSLEPEHWHPDLHRFIAVLNEKLEARKQHLDASALRRTSMAGDVGGGKIAEDPDAFLNTFLQQSEDFLQDDVEEVRPADSSQKRSDASQNKHSRFPTQVPKRKGTVRFEDEVAPSDVALLPPEAAADRPLKPRQRSEADVALQVRDSDSSKTGSEIDSFVAADEEGDHQRTTADDQDLAAALLGIQDQLTELRQLVRRNLANSD